ncbi:hypothetical protein MASR1M60_16930 [Rhodocyclaceae bacterium]
MSDEQSAPAMPATPSTASPDLLDRISPTVLIVVAVGATLIALLAIVSMIMLVSLTSDVRHMEDQVRKLNKHSKGMEQEVAELRSTLEAMSARATAAAPPQTAVPRATHIDTADPVSDCVIRSGSKGGLAGCLQ